MRAYWATLPILLDEISIGLNVPRRVTQMAENGLLL
jgi:hypothetical protein